MRKRCAIALVLTKAAALKRRPEPLRAPTMGYQIRHRPERCQREHCQFDRGKHGGAPAATQARICRVGQAFGIGGGDGHKGRNLRSRIE